MRPSFRRCDGSGRAEGRRGQARRREGRTRDNPAEAIFLGRRKLNGEGSEKETYHVEFDLSAAGLDYKAGDSFGVFASNDPRLADAVIALIGARPEHDIGGKSLREILIRSGRWGQRPTACSS